MDWRNNLYNILKIRGLKIEFLADALSLSKQRIYNLMQQNDIKLSTLQKIADALSISVSELLENKEFTSVCPHCKKPIKISVNLE